MIIHITHHSQWDTAEKSGEYGPPSLVEEGFIHCSTPEQVLEPANTMYRGRQGMVLLIIDPERVRASIVYEDCYDSGQSFPHIYGPLNVNAVERAVPFPTNPDGSFELPNLDG